MLLNEVLNVTKIENERKEDVGKESKLCIDNNVIVFFVERRPALCEHSLCL